MAASTPTHIGLVPAYTPGQSQLPPLLRGLAQEEYAFHFTEPEHAATIVAMNEHRPTRVGAGRHGVFLSRHGPHTHDGHGLLAAFFGGTLARAPRLWAVLVYLTVPNATGLPLVADPDLPGNFAFYTPTHRSGIVDVAQYLLAWGIADPPATGRQWFWRVP